MREEQVFLACWHSRSCRDVVMPLLGSCPPEVPTRPPEAMPLLLRPCAHTRDANARVFRPIRAEMAEKNANA